MDDQERNELANPHDADEEPAVKKNGEVDNYVPYQPALDAGISEEMDRLNFRRIQLIKRQSQRELTPEEEAEFAELQDKVVAYFDSKFPRRLPDEDLLDKLEQRYKLGDNGTKTP